MASNAVVEMLECMEAETMTVLESWEARLKWQHQQQQQRNTATSNDIPVQGRHEFTLEAPFQRRNGQCMEEEEDHNHQGNFLGGEGLDANVWPELIQYPMLGDASSLDGFSSGVCPPVVGSAEKENMAAPLDAPAQKGVECSHGTDTVTTTATRCSHAHRKRKVGDAEATVEKDACKRKKGEADGGAVLLKQEMANPDTAIATKGSAKEERSCESSRNDATKASEVVQKPDYIHVRARRGQATDSHSLAERVRREKISERMKVLQNLVPGCDKITGKAGMLDEIINYVQSLQRQVEFLSMKLATLNLVLDFNRNGLIPATEKMAAVYGNGIPVAAGAVSSQLTDTAFSPSNVTQTSLTANCALDLPIDLSQAALCRHLNEALPASDTLTNTCFDVHAAPYSWNAGLRTHHSQGR